MGNADFSEGMGILLEGCEQLGISLTEKMQKQFADYFCFLIRKNEVMNLTAITDPKEAAVKHFLDSLALIRAVRPDAYKRMIDVGTGAGFPGIPVKIVFPELEMVLADSLNKRILFLQELIDECRFEKISVIHGRAEELGRNRDYREAFDLCVSRAVSNLTTLSEYCLPFVKEGGVFVSYKSGNVSEELQQAAYAIRCLGGEEEKPVTFRLPCSDIERSLIVVKKQKKTPAKYPRRSGLPAKEPLKR